MNNPAKKTKCGKHASIVEKAGAFL